MSERSIDKSPPVMEKYNSRTTQEVEVKVEKVGNADSSEGKEDSFEKRCNWISCRWARHSSRNFDARGFESRWDELGDVGIAMVVFEEVRRKGLREGHCHLPFCIPGCWNCSTRFGVAVEYELLSFDDRKSRRARGGQSLRGLLLLLLLLWLRENERKKGDSKCR